MPLDTLDTVFSQRVFSKVEPIATINGYLNVFKWCAFNFDDLNNSEEDFTEVFEEIDDYCQGKFHRLSVFRNIKFFMSAIVAKNNVERFGLSLGVDYGTAADYIQKSAKCVKLIRELQATVLADSAKLGPEVQDFNKRVSQFVKANLDNITRPFEDGEYLASEIYEIFCLALHFDIRISAAFALNLPYELKEKIATLLCDETFGEVCSYYEVYCGCPILRAYTYPVLRRNMYFKISIDKNQIAIIQHSSGKSEISVS